ncbi:hypothetical protein V8G54_024856, partial [Vigna mungo]
EKLSSLGTYTVLLLSSDNGSVQPPLYLKYANFISQFKCNFVNIFIYLFEFNFYNIFSLNSCEMNGNVGQRKSQGSCGRECSHNRSHRSTHDCVELDNHSRFARTCQYEFRRKTISLNSFDHRPFLNDNEMIILIFLLQL